MIQVNKLKKEFLVKTDSGKLLKDMFYPDHSSVTAVENITFNINNGESVAFLGPNGAGKTTAIKMMTGLLKPDNGSVDINGFTPFDRDERFLKDIGLLMGGKAGLDWDLTPNQSFNLLKAIYEIDTDEYNKWLGELSRLLDLESILDKQLRKLSLGERMKCELIGSILHKPKILFLDEPTVGLDIVSKRKIRKFLKRLQEENGTTIILTSHEMEDVETVCDRVIIINKGIGVFDGMIDELLNKYSDKKYISIRFTEYMEEYPSSKYIQAQNKYDINYVVPNSDLTNVIQSALETGKVDDIDIMSPPLEKVISEIFEK